VIPDLHQDELTEGMLLLLAGSPEVTHPCIYMYEDTL
jgi:hypothetical protein